MKNTQQKYVLLFSGIIGFAMNLALAMTHGVAPDGPFWGLAVLCGAAAGALLVGLTSPSPIDQPEAVDIWDPQAKLMAISGQNLPSLPVVDKGTLLYFALILEELGELQATLVKTTRRAHITHFTPPGGNVVGYEFLCALESLNDLNLSASFLRDRIAALPDDYSVNVTRGEAQNMLDDITDVAVTTAGFGLAAGLPVRAAYAEVCNSNLSKANPETGLIDKEPSGKWIKGANFRKPDLGNVLDGQHRAWTSARLTDQT